jgi:prepilin-type N-terminal cleavage/methylation domain-containing protein
MRIMKTERKTQNAKRKRSEKISLGSSTFYVLRSKRESSSTAFTLIEVLVSVSIFAIVMLIATGAVFSIVEANKKTHSLKSVMTNLNFALESMARDMRVGFGYTCNGSSECAAGGTIFNYKANRSVDGDSSYDSQDLNDRIEYTLASERLTKRVYGSGPIATLGAVPITASEIHILSMRFYLIGGSSSDGKQPKVLITIEGYAGVGQTRSDFNIQTTVSQRSIDS